MMLEVKTEIVNSQTPVAAESGGCYSFVMSRNLTQPDAHIPPDLIGLTPVTPEQFERLCRKHRDLRLELTSTGELIVMPGTGLETGKRNANLTYQLTAWTINDGSGVCFDSSTIFALPNG